jgi:hypothetical protein
VLYCIQRDGSSLPALVRNITGIMPLSMIRIIVRHPQRGITALKSGFFRWISSLFVTYCLNWYPLTIHKLLLLCPESTSPLDRIFIIYRSRYRESHAFQRYSTYSSCPSCGNTALSSLSSSCTPLPQSQQKFGFMPPPRVWGSSCYVPASPMPDITILERNRLTSLKVKTPILGPNSTVCKRLLLMGRGKSAATEGKRDILARHRCKRRLLRL